MAKLHFQVSGLGIRLFRNGKMGFSSAVGLAPIYSLEFEMVYLPRQENHDDCFICSHLSLNYIILNLVTWAIMKLSNTIT